MQQGKAPSSGLIRRVMDVLLTTDRQQRIRLSMTVMAAVLMLCCIAALQLVAAAGLADAVHVHWFSVVCSLGLMGVYGLIRSGYSLRWDDPALTFFQIVSSVSCTAVAYVIAGSARGITLPILAVILIFGVFGLSPRQMLFVLFYGMVVFGIALSIAQWSAGCGTQPLALTAAYTMMIVVVLASCTFINLRVLASRRRKMELAQAAAKERERATRDELTGLHNRRFMLEIMDLEVVQACPVVLETGTTIHLTVSIGVAQLQPDQETPIGLLRRADEALYAAKAQGRNRVVCADPLVRETTVADR